MCKLCNEKPVYEFTNKRRLCKRCFVNYFQKKVLYTIRKFDMVRRGDIVGYRKDNSCRGVVLEQILFFLSEKCYFSVVKSPSKKATKIAVNSFLDLESEEIVKILIKGDASNLKKDLPIVGKIIKPLYLFDEKEILLYAKIKNLKFKEQKKNQDKIKNFIDEFEKKHPEVKRAIVNSLLKLYKK